MAKSIKWLVEDEVVALYLAMYGDSGLDQSQGDVIQLMANTVILKKGFAMRIKNYLYIFSDGEEGLDAGYPEGHKKYRDLYDLFHTFPRHDFTRYVKMIIDVRNKLPKVGSCSCS